MFFSSGKNPERILAVHLDDDACHFSVIICGEKPVVEWYKKKQFAPGHAGHSAGLKLVAEVLREAALRYHDLMQIAVVLGAPHAFVQARHLSKRFEKPTAITEKIFNDLLSADREHIETHILKPHSGALEVVSRLLAHIRVNGYATSALFGKTGESVEFDMVVGYIQSEIYRSLDRLLCEFFPRAKSSFYVREALYAQAFLSGKNDSGLLLDLRADTTHLSLFQNSFLVENSVSMVGTRTLYETALRALGASHAEFSSVLALFARGDLGEVESRRLSSALARARTVWLEELVRDWSAVRDQHHLPRKLFLLLPENARLLLGDFLTSAEFRKMMRALGDFEPVALKESTVLGFAPSESDVPYSELYLIEGVLQVMHSNQKEI